jgi:hypothetical protein
LPQLRVSAAEREYPVDRTALTTNADRYGIATEDYVRLSDNVESLNAYEVRLEWDFSNLLFDREEVSISEESRRRAEQRNQLITQTSELYYERLQLLADEKVKGDSMQLEDSLRLNLRLQQVTSLLNQLCGESLFD